MIALMSEAARNIALIALIVRAIRLCLGAIMGWLRSLTPINHPLSLSIYIYILLLATYTTLAAAVADVLLYSSNNINGTDPLGRKLNYRFLFTIGSTIIGLNA